MASGGAGGASGAGDDVFVPGTRIMCKWTDGSVRKLHARSGLFAKRGIRAREGDVGRSSQIFSSPVFLPLSAEPAGALLRRRVHMRALSWRHCLLLLGVACACVCRPLWLAGTALASWGVAKILVDSDWPQPLSLAPARQTSLRLWTLSQQTERLIRMLNLRRVEKASALAGVGTRMMTGCRQTSGSTMSTTSTVRVARPSFRPIAPGVVS